jgi:hypothetical protein
MNTETLSTELFARQESLMRHELLLLLRQCSLCLRKSHTRFQSRFKSFKEAFMDYNCVDHRLFICLLFEFQHLPSEILHLMCV